PLHMQHAFDSRFIFWPEPPCKRTAPDNVISQREGSSVPMPRISRRQRQHRSLSHSEQGISSLVTDNFCSCPPLQSVSLCPEVPRRAILPHESNHRLKVVLSPAMNNEQTLGTVPYRGDCELSPMQFFEYR